MSPHSKQKSNREVASWEPPYSLLAVLMFLLLLLGALILSTSATSSWQGLGQNLISELVGFLLTAWVVETLFKRQEQFRRDASVARRFSMLAYQVALTDARLDALLAGKAAFGAQYVPDLRKALSALERLDWDCAELLSQELDTAVAQRVTAFQHATRGLNTRLESLQNEMLERPSSGRSQALAEDVVAQISDWKINGSEILREKDASGDSKA